MKNTIKALKSLTQKFSADEQGQDLIEYTLLLAFVSLASAALLTQNSEAIKGIWSSTNNTLGNAANAAVS
jgi:Flp pilus assembly pilin Flp